MLNLLFYLKTLFNSLKTSFFFSLLFIFKFIFRLKTKKDRTFFELNLFLNFI